MTLLDLQERKKRAGMGAIDTAAAPTKKARQHHELECLPESPWETDLREQMLVRKMTVPIVAVHAHLLRRGSRLPEWLPLQHKCTV